MGTGEFVMSMSITPGTCSCNVCFPSIEGVNIPLLRKAVEWVETQAELSLSDGHCEWDQTLWAGKTSCGTTYCVAGYVAFLEGWNLTPTPGIEHISLCSKDGKSAHIPDIAHKVLGLNRWQRDSLFNSTNGASDVRRIAEEIAGEPL